MLRLGIYNIEIKLCHGTNNVKWINMLLCYYDRIYDYWVKIS